MQIGQAAKDCIENPLVCLFPFVYLQSAYRNMRPIMWIKMLILDMDRTCVVDTVRYALWIYFKRDHHKCLCMCLYVKWLSGYILLMCMSFI